MQARGLCRFWLIAVIAVSIGLAACGSSNDGATSTILASPSPTTQPPQTVTTAPDPTTCTPLEPETTTVVANPRWVDGMKRNLVVVRQRVDSLTRYGSEPSTTTSVSLTVAAAEDGWAFSWPYGASQFYGLSGSDEQAVEQLGNLIPDPVELQYRVDQWGIFAGVENPGQVRQFATDMVAGFSQAGVDPAIADGLRQLYASMTDEQLTAGFSEDPQLFHYFDGAELDIGEEYTAEVELPNQLGGAPFPAQSTIRIRQVADADGCVVIEESTVVDPASVAEILRDSLAETFGAEGAEAVESLPAVGDIRIDNSITARWDPGSGFFVEVKGRQAISIDGREQVELTLIADQTPRR